MRLYLCNYVVTVINNFSFKNIHILLILIIINIVGLLGKFSGPIPEMHFSEKIFALPDSLPTGKNSGNLQKRCPTRVQPADKARVAIRECISALPDSIPAGKNSGNLQKRCPTGVQPAGKARVGIQECISALPDSIPAGKNSGNYLG